MAWFQLGSVWALAWLASVIRLSCYCCCLCTYLHPAAALFSFPSAVHVYWPRCPKRLVCVCVWVGVSVLACVRVGGCTCRNVSERL